MTGKASTAARKQDAFGGFGEGDLRRLKKNASIRRSIIPKHAGWQGTDEAGPVRLA